MYRTLLPHAIVFACAALIAPALAAVILSRPRKPGGLWMVAALLASGIYCFGAAVEAQVVGEAAKVFWSKVEYIGYVHCAFCLFGFTVRYLGLEVARRRKVWIGLWTPSVLMLALAWTNERHGWVWLGFIPGPAEYNVQIYEHGPAFWVFLGYTYVLSVVSAGLLWRVFTQSHGVQRKQLAMILAGIVCPLASSAVYALGWTPVMGMDVSPIGFLGSVAVLAWSLEHYHLLDLIPAAREAMVEGVPDAMMVFDDQDRLVDANAAARALLARRAGELIGKNAAEVLAGWPAVIEMLHHRRSGEVFAIDAPHGETTFEARISSLKERTQSAGGCLLVFRDVSEARQAAKERERLIAELQQALAQVKTLSGMLPICAGCKRIRDDAGYWSQIETYISKHSEARFTHGLCPECSKKYFPGIDITKKT
jgi:PAS domain S-box-containing protein